MLADTIRDFLDTPCDIAEQLMEMPGRKDKSLAIGWEQGNAQKTSTWGMARTLAD